MDEKELKKCNRHDFVIVSQTGRDRICTEVLKNYNIAEQYMVRDVFSGKYGANGIPGIVRRAEITESDLLPVGFVPQERFAGRRLRIGAFAYFAEVMDIITPYKLLQMSISKRNSCLEAVSEVAKLAISASKTVGVLGSAGLEIFTRIPYTNEESDIDLVIKDCTYEEISKIFKQIKAIGTYYNIPIDLEIALTNGYGVKAEELFMDTQTLLGKSLDDVTLLDRKAVLKALTKKREE